MHMWPKKVVFPSDSRVCYVLLLCTKLHRRDPLAFNMDKFLSLGVSDKYEVCLDFVFTDSRVCCPNLFMKGKVHSKVLLIAQTGVGTISRFKKIAV